MQHPPLTRRAPGASSSDSSSSSSSSSSSTTSSGNALWLLCPEAVLQDPHSADRTTGSQKGLSWKETERSSRSIPLPGQGFHSLHQVAQNPISPGHEYCQGWRIHHFSGLTLEPYRRITFFILRHQCIFKFGLFVFSRHDGKGGTIKQ